MELAIANQMINTMNQSMAHMDIAGSKMPIPTSNLLFYIVLDGAQAGPFSEAEVIRLIQEKAYYHYIGLAPWIHSLARVSTSARDHEVGSTSPTPNQ